MTELYSEWRDFYAKRVSSWMSLEELRTACGKLATTDSPSPEVLLIHAMHALEECVRLDEHGLPDDLIDREGNRVRPVFSTDEIAPGEVCDDCFRPLVEN